MGCLSSPWLRISVRRLGHPCPELPSRTHSLPNQIPFAATR